MAGEADDPDVQTEVFAAELSTDPEFPGGLQCLRFKRLVAESAALRVAGLGQAVQVARRGQLDGF